MWARPYARSEPKIKAIPLAEYQMLLVSLGRCMLPKAPTHLFRRGCSRRVHHMDTMINIEGEMDASHAPRTNRKTSKGANEVKAAQIMHDAPQPKKHAMIHQLTGNLTSAQTDTAGETKPKALPASN